MGEGIYIHRYRLVSRHRLNSRSETVTHPGALIRTDGGFGCLQPWPELGDPPLDALLNALKNKQRHSTFIQEALRCAKIDGQARREGVSLFTDISVPQSHATITGEEEQIREAVSKGFSCIKLKGGRDLQHDLCRLHSFHSLWPQLRWRVDFNSSLSGVKFEAFLLGLSDSLRGRIDFFEDPCPLADSPWLKRTQPLPVAIAIDREQPQIAKEKFRYLVAKPAIAHLPTLCETAKKECWRVVVTSNMDHPLGQSYAAWAAGTAKQAHPGLIDPHCGLQTHHLFEATEFSEQLGDVSPEWHAASGTGLGFDNQLEQLNWDRI